MKTRLRVPVFIGSPSLQLVVQSQRHRGPPCDRRVRKIAPFIPI
ncbi:hypothetical protein [Herbaspirillum sp. NPDC101396]